jgi:hypothetical protein
MFFGSAISAWRFFILFTLAAGLLSAQTLTITSPLTLPPAQVGVPYSPLQLSATGGTPPYTWSTPIPGSSALPPNMTLSAAGVLSGQTTVNSLWMPIIRVTDSAGNFTQQTFTLPEGTAGTSTRSGVIAQVAVGAGWTTTIYLINTSETNINTAQITFRGNSGNPLPLGISYTIAGYPQALTTSQQNFTMSPNTTIAIQTTEPISGPLTEGWADIFTTGGINVFAIFQQTQSNGVVAEGTSAQQGQFTSSLVLPYDNTNGNTTTAALVSLASVPITINATIWDQNGNQLGMQMLNVPVLGRPTPFAVPTLFPFTAGKTGSIRFDNVSTTDPLSGIAFSFGSLLGGSFTSVPMLPPTM